MGAQPVPVVHAGPEPGFHTYDDLPDVLAERAPGGVPIAFDATGAAPVPDDLTRVADNFRLIGDTIAELRVDTIVLIGTDHIRQFFSDNSPAFVIGKADHREVADVIGGREVLPEQIDFASSSEWRLDHGFVIPLLYLTPRLDIPVVPIHVNTALPPLPRPQRFAALGAHVRRSVLGWESDARVALITSGHMATDIGGPRQFLGGGSPDPDFDRDAVRWMIDGDLDAAVAGCTFHRIMSAGNITYQYVNVLAALAAMDGRPADFGEATESRFASSPFFLWRAA